MKDFVLKNGLVLGAIQVVMLFVSYIMGIDFMMQNWWIIFQTYLIPIGLVVYFVLEFRKLRGGYATFKESFSVAFGILAAAGFILTFFSILLYNFIDVDFAIMYKEASIEKFYQMMQGFGVPEAEIDENILILEEQDTFSVTSLARDYFFSLPFLIMGSLIIAAFIKRNKPEFEA